MKLPGGFDSGPLAPNTASWIRWPGRASRAITTRFGALKPLMSWPAGLAEHERQLAVDPDFRVVVDDDLEDDGRAGRVERADLLRDRHVDAVPAERESAMRASCLEALRLDHRPARVVKGGDTGMRLDVVAYVGGPRRRSASLLPPTHDPRHVAPRAPLSPLTPGLRSRRAGGRCIRSHLARRGHRQRSPSRGRRPGTEDGES